MPNAIDLLKKDHREVEQLFERFEATRDPAIAQKICDELTVHSTVEEELLYPILERLDSMLEEEAEKEHTEAKELIAKIEAADDDALAPLVQKLKEAIEHHVEEEEGEAFPKLQEQAGDEVRALAERLEQRKTELQKSVSKGGRTLDLTKDELYARAQEANIEGRSKMTKDELAKALELQ